MKYRPDIDGLRACAVLPVVLFHMGVPGIKGGFVGVDVFFVISGYVISAQLLESINSGSFSILKFYERRVRRIFPALLFIMALTTAAAVFLLLPPQMTDFSESLFASAFFSSNFFFWKQSGYFDVASSFRPLLHLWSLGVEEQFYIFMPLAMYLAYALGSRWRWRFIFWAAFVASLGLSVAITNTAPSANFFLLPTRAWELLLGALLILTPPPRPTRTVAEILAAIGVLLLAFSIFDLNENMPFPGANALYPCIGAALLLYSGSSYSPFFNRMISIKPLVFVGLISYSLYLVHWPLIVLSRYYLLRDPRGDEVVLLIAGSLALAVFSYKFVEFPFRRGEFARQRRVLFAQGAGAMAVVAMIGLAGASSGFAWRFPDFNEQAANPRTEQWRTGVCFLGIQQPPEQWNLNKCTLTRGNSGDMVLWGDSFAAHYVPGLLANERAIPYNIIEYTAAGCPPVIQYHSYSLPNCQQFNKGAIEMIEEIRPKVVILSARWDLLLAHGFFKDLQDTVDRIRATGAKVVVVGESPEFGIDVRSLSYWLRNRERGASSWQISNTDPTVREYLRTTTKGATLVDPIAALCHGNICPYEKGGRLLYVDYGHYSIEGSEVAVKALQLGMTSEETQMN
jgi:peptidoglycan/LPS O-acetylase OafA/YrhL